MNISLPDAVIAASALSLDTTPVTRNEHDFVRVPGLKVSTPSGTGNNNARPILPALRGLLTGEVGERDFSEIMAGGVRLMETAS